MNTIAVTAVMLLSMGAGDTPSTERVVTRGIVWLARHQESDGTWHFAPPEDSKCGYANAGKWRSPSAATALVLLSLHACGQTHKYRGPYQATISKGLKSLIRMQESNGDLSKSDDEPMFSHAVATLALTEAHGLTQQRTLRTAAQSGITFIVARQDAKSGGWPSHAGQSPSDWVTAWQVIALRSGELAGLNVPRHVMQKAERFLLHAQGESGLPPGDSEPKGAALWRRASILNSQLFLSQPRPEASRYPEFGGYNVMRFVKPSELRSKQPEASKANSDKGGYNVMHAPKSLETSPSGADGSKVPPDDSDSKVADADKPSKPKTDSLETGREWLSRTGPAKNDVFYNFHATVVLADRSEKRVDEWWQEIRKPLIADQIKEGDEAGSWFNPQEAFAAEGGRLLQTAMNVLSLAVYYRYLPIVRGGYKKDSPPKSED